MALFQARNLTEADGSVLDMIERQKDRLRLYTQNAPKRWLGSLRRSTFARAIQGSNSIEGYNATLDDAIAVVEGEQPLDEGTETAFAIKGYRDALTYIGQASQDPYFEFSKQFLKSLHFMMLGHDMSKNPGQWRPGSVAVVNHRTGDTVYEAPDVEMVNPLVEEFVAYLKADTKEPSIIKAAMAHLNLTMIHPFRDGNGRMARAIQTLVLAQGGTLHPVFSSIEEWLGRNTEEYYTVLAITGNGAWHPERDTQTWVRFCLKAHYQQAATLIRRNDEYSRLFDQITALIASLHLPDRSSVSLFDTALGFRLTNSRYRADAEVTELVASRDLKKICDSGLLIPMGEKRGRAYRASPILVELRAKVRMPKPLENPYDVVARRARKTESDEEPRLPGL